MFEHGRQLTFSENERQPQTFSLSGRQTQYAPGNLGSKNNHLNVIAWSRIYGIWPQSWWINQKFIKGNYNIFFIFWYYNGPYLDNS